MFDIPTSRADVVRELEFGDPEVDIAAGLVLRDAVSDESGALHLLAPPDAQHRGHRIIVLDVEGGPVRAYEIDAAIGCLAIDESRSYVGIADDTGWLVRFQPR